jgi:hypothetical protein
VLAYELLSNRPLSVRNRNRYSSRQGRYLMQLFNTCYEIEKHWMRGVKREIKTPFILSLKDEERRYLMGAAIVVPPLFVNALRH